jgi:hypothetical protein
VHQFRTIVFVIAGLHCYNVATCMQETWYTLLHHVANKLHRCVSCCCIPLVWTDNLRYSSEMSLVV